MELVLFTDGIYPFVIGGMQKHSYHLSKYLSKFGIKTYIFYVKGIQSYDITEYYTASELEFLEFIPLDFPRSKYFPGHYIFDSYIYSKNIFNRFLKLNIKPDIIYIQGFSGWYYLNQRQNFGIKAFTVINFHGLEMFQKSKDCKAFLQNIFLRPFVKRNLKMADASISLGGALTSLLKLYSKDVIMIPNGIERKWLTDLIYTKTKNENRKFVFIGRYEPRKGIDELHCVINQLQTEEKYFFEFIGPIPEDKRITNPKVKYHGIIRDEIFLMNILREADILICPSWSEGMPIVILEAMASGCAIISTKVGAIPDLVDDDNGWLLTPGNINELKEAIIASIFLSDKDLEFKKEQSLKKIKEKYLWEGIIQQTICELTSKLV